MKSIISLLALFALILAGCSSVATNPVVTSVVGDLTTPAGIKNDTEIATVLVLSANPDKVLIVEAAATAIKAATSDGSLTQALLSTQIAKVVDSSATPIIRVIVQQKFDALFGALTGVPIVILDPATAAKVNAFADGLLAGVADVTRAARSIPPAK